VTSAQEVEVAGRAGEPINLPVGSTAATGHEWQLELPDDVKLVGETEPVEFSEGRPDGAATGSKLIVTAPAGRYELLARLTRPWETTPVRELRIILNVSQQ
jgi:hypothetical protein